MQAIIRGVVNSKLSFFQFDLDKSLQTTLGPSKDKYMFTNLVRMIEMCLLYLARLSIIWSHASTFLSASLILFLKMTFYLTEVVFTQSPYYIFNDSSTIHPPKPNFLGSFGERVLISKIVS